MLESTLNVVCFILIVVMAIHPSGTLKAVAVAVLTVDCVWGAGQIFAWVMILALALVGIRIAVFVLFGKVV